MFANLMKHLLRIGHPLPRQLVNGYLEWTLVRDVLTMLDINCVLDVGANQGQYAKNLRRIGYRGHICSFEPIKQDFETLLDAFKDDPHWTGFNFALGNENTQKPFNVATECSAMSSFLSPTDPNWRLHTATVEIKRLDTIFEPIMTRIGMTQPRVFLKMDTQGYDVEVIRGAQSHIDKILGLQSEISIMPIYSGMPHYLDALGFYESLDFCLFGASEAARNPDEDSLLEMNCIMVHKNGQGAR
ncbi:MAG: FkbM family methyltransferase [Anaerolineales bacterium]|nr:FkbM family methyltransferase [Anaerolineales bacterium]